MSDIVERLKAFSTEDVNREVVPALRQAAAEIVRLRTELAEVRKDLECQTLSRSAWKMRAEQAEPERDALRSIVDRLPKTADGVPVVSGDKVYWFSQFDPHKPILELTYRSGLSASLQNPYRESHGVHQCYSTRAAAESARRVAKGGPQ